MNELGFDARGTKFWKFLSLLSREGNTPDSEDFMLGDCKVFCSKSWPELDVFQEQSRAERYMLPACS